MIYTKNYLLVCENTIVDDKNKITLVNIFDYLSALQTPIIQCKFSIVGNYWVDEIPSGINSLNLTISLLKKNNEPINDPLSSIKVNLKPENKQKIGIIVEVSNLTFPNFGEYKLVLNTEDKKIIGEIPLIIKKQDK